MSDDDNDDVEHKDNVEEEKDNDDDVDSQKIKENDLNAAKIKEFEKIKNEFGYDTTKNIDFLKILGDYLSEMGVNNIGDFNENFIRLYTGVDEEKKIREIIEKRELEAERKRLAEEAERKRLAEEAERKLELEAEKQRLAEEAENKD